MSDRIGNAVVRTFEKIVEYRDLKDTFLMKGDPPKAGFISEEDPVVVQYKLRSTLTSQVTTEKVTTTVGELLPRAKTFTDKPVPLTRGERERSKALLREIQNVAKGTHGTLEFSDSLRARFFDGSLEAKKP